jgi:hypothetical protein
VLVFSVRFVPAQENTLVEQSKFHTLLLNGVAIAIGNVFVAIGRLTRHTHIFPNPRRAKLAEMGVPMKPRPSAKNVSGDFDKFTDFMRRLMAVPHSEIKARLEAEKKTKRTSKLSVSLDSVASSKKP